MFIGKTFGMLLLYVSSKNLEEYILSNFTKFSVKTQEKTVYLSFQGYFSCIC